jgi:oligopeptide transport system substrate-binding protein
MYIMHAFVGLYKLADNGQPYSPGSALDGANTVPGLAKAPPVKKVNADGTVTLTYTLRDNLKWSDGTPLTAQDVAYGWQRLIDPKTGGEYGYMIEGVKNAVAIENGKMTPDQLGVQAPDDKTVVITLNNDIPYFDQIAGFATTYPVKKAIIDKYGDQWTFDPKTYICDGPYRMKEWVHNSYIIFEKNPYYYDAANVKGPQEIKWMLMDDNNAVLSAWKDGTLDFTLKAPVDEIPTLLKSGDMKIATSLGSYYLSYNCQKAPFNNPKVREAFTLAIDRNYIVNDVTRQGQTPATGFVPAGVPDAPGATSDFRTVGGDYYSVKAADYQANVKKAQALLADAGYPGGKGFPVVQYTYDTDDVNRAIAEALQNMWQTNLGVTVTISNMDWNTFLDYRRTGQYSGIVRDRWLGDYDDANTFLDMFTTTSGNNDSQYHVPEYDALIKQIASTTDMVARTKLMHQAEDMLLGRDWAVCPLYYYVNPYMLKKGIKGVFYSPLNYFMFTQAHK